MARGASKIAGRTYLGSIMYQLSQLEKLSDEQLDTEDIWTYLQEADSVLDDAVVEADENGFLDG